MMKKAALNILAPVLVAFCLTLAPTNQIDFVSGVSERSRLAQAGSLHEKLQSADFKEKSRELHVNLKAALVIDNNDGSTLYAKNAEKVRPIASISKLLTTMTLLDMNYDRNKIIALSRDDCRRSSKSNLYRGDQVRAEDLFKAALISSDNRASRALARTFGGSQEQFAANMNETAKRLGMKNTFMVEPTGLNEKNRSTAADCAVLVNRALGNPEIVRATQTKRHTFEVTNRKGKKRTRRVGTTNLLLYSRYKTLIGKTGYIRASDYCLATVIENKKGERLTIVTLGAPWSKVRFKETRRLADFGFRKLRKKAKLIASGKSSKS